MKTDLVTLKDSFKFSYEAFESSRLEEKEIRDMYHNRQYSSQQEAILERRGQPAETFNVIKLFGRLLVGYYSTVVNTIKVQPRQQSDTNIALLLHDIVQHTFEYNHFETEGDKVKLDGILSGIMAVYENVIDLEKKDTYGRPVRRIELSHVPSKEILLDPMSRKEDYSDARFVHRFKWVSEDYLKKILKEHNSPKRAKEILDNLEAYENHVRQNDTEFTVMYEDRFIGYYKQYDNYLLIHSVIVDEEDQTWSVFWCGDEEISREKVVYEGVRFPYRIQRTHSSDKAEYYGIFREVKESQKSINQAVLKIQLMANSQKAFVQEGAVENLDEFVDGYNRVNAVIPVKKLSGIKIENLDREVLQQYAIVDKAFDRIQRILGINDSFLGMAYAADSGRKVKLQQNATTLALRYLTTKIEQFYRLVGWDVVLLTKQFYTANEALRISDEVTGQRWVEVNKPMQIWTGEFDENNNPIMDTPFEEVLDPKTNEPLVNDEGNYVIAPIPEQDTEISFTEVDLTIDSTAYNDEDEKNQLMIESVLQGNIGQTLMQIDPSAFLAVASLSIEGIRTKHSHHIAEIIRQTAQAVKGQPIPVPGSPQQRPSNNDTRLPDDGSAS